jgi:uncharacterized protein
VQEVDGRFIYSASDLNNYLECAHLVELERLAAAGELVRPEPDATTELIARKGTEHEAQYAARLERAFGEGFVAFNERPERSIEALQQAEERTLEAMQRGARIIYQATFFDGTFVGHADFLRRIETPSECFAWNYEVIDTKLALSPKPYFLVQLCNYSEHVARLTGTMPERMAIVLGSGLERRFRVDEYLAYYRHLKAAFLARTQSHNETYPLVCAHCDICRWSDRCERQRDRDDHLSIVAWIRRDQIDRLETSGITTVAALAAATDEQRPRGMSETTFANARAQAALQHRHRQSGKHSYEFRDIAQGDGFFKFPAPASGDIFFDMEGDPLFHPDRGLEYLFGAYLSDEDRYVRWWAKTADKEREAFEAFMDFSADRLQQYPGLHIYHYAPYEVTALKRLAGRFASRGDLLDDFLRRGIFVDLFGVVRQSLRISQPRYSLKKIEAFYELQRHTKTLRGDDSIVMFESWLSTHDNALLEDIERYNEDDCRSTYYLRGWLLARRDEINASREDVIPWYEHATSPTPEEEPERTERERRLLDGLHAFDSLDDLREASSDTRARWLLGNLLQYHRREAKPAWWKHYDRLANPNELEERDSEALGGLRMREDIAPYKLGPKDRNFVYTYTYPEQEHNLGSKPVDPFTGKSAGTIVRIDDAMRTLEIKLSGTIVPESLQALIPGTPIPERAQRAAIERVAQSYDEQHLSTEYPATYDLLLAARPRFRDATQTAQPERVDAKSLSQRIRALDNSSLFIQGPPGSGKSTKAARAIADLLADGKRVGIMANSHKAVHALLHKVEAVAAERGVQFRGCHKESGLTEGSKYVSSGTSSIESSSELSSLTDPACQLASGTVFAWSDVSLVGAYDYLFIDEAGQIALADALGCSLAARNLVLLGDPLQLKQVSQASHPTGTELSILQHLLGDHATIPPDRGIFLDVSYRMHPDICNFISHAVYEDRLHAHPITALHRIESPGLQGSGLRYVGIDHVGRGRRSTEEADAVVREIRTMLEGTVMLTQTRPITTHDILVVAPYNAQRKLITERLEAAGLRDVRVGTVDKFQGQEAPVVFYSMATSSGEDMPRDMEFLFEKNRLNVAISRAQCMSVLVCSPRLLEIRCSKPEQMALANLLCAFVETADYTSPHVTSSAGS